MALKIATDLKAVPNPFSPPGSIEFRCTMRDDQAPPNGKVSHTFTLTLNQDNNLNYAKFDISEDRAEFIARSLAAGEVARTARELINTGRELSPRDQKNNIYTTCMPWLDLRAIEHPIYAYKSADIPLIAWGRYSDQAGDTMSVPFCIQAHHGFVDGYHVHLLLQRLAERITQEIR